jgi:hypothetical protein
MTINQIPPIHTPNRTNSRYGALPLVTARYGSLFFIGFRRPLTRLTQEFLANPILAKLNQILAADSQTNLSTQQVALPIAEVRNLTARKFFARALANGHIGNKVN